jgi:hypothetical protein
LTTYLPNAKGRAVASSAIAFVDTDANANAATAAPRISLLSANNEIEVILPPPPPLPLVDASPHAVGKTKKKRMKVRAPDDASTATLPPPTAPAAKKSKTTKKKKAAEPVDLCTMPMWVSTNDTKKHCIVAIAHEQKWVAGDAGTITGDVANKPTSNYQWC